MSTPNKNLLCEVVFRDFRKNKRIRITGKTDIEKLMSPKEKFIHIENSFFDKQQWKTIISHVPKVDVIKITAFKAQHYLIYENGDLIVNPGDLKEEIRLTM